MRLIPGAAIAGLLLLAVAGCTGGPHHTAAKTSAHPAAATPTASPSPAAPLKLGQAVTVDRGPTGTWTATVTAWKRAAATTQPVDDMVGSPGWRFDAAQVRVCHTAAGSDTTPDDNSVGWNSWAARGTDDTVVIAGEFVSEILTVTQYPTSYVVPVGQCIAGWVPFKVAAASTIAAVIYQPKTDSGVRAAAGTWRVG